MASSSAQRGFARGFALLAALIVLLGGVRFAVSIARTGHGPDLAGVARDFRVVYCGAEAVRTGADPYRVEPLRSCEHRVGLEPGEPDWAVTPLPLPGYAIALFVPLTLLPFGAAKLVWIAALALAAGLAAATIAAILRVPALAVGLIFWPTIGALNLAFGEPVPLAIAALCCAGYALERGAYRSAAVLAVLAAVEPHVAAPAIVALAVLVPRARLPLLLALVAGGLLSFAALGVERNIEYFAVLLPQHGAAELLARDQLGLSRYLYLAGMPASFALALGGVSYLLAIAAGIVLGRRLASGLRRPALLVLFPVATAMFGGSFIHDVQIAAALPAATLLAPASRLARISIGLLVVDWTLWPGVEAARVIAAAAGTSVVAFPPERWRARLGWIVATPLLTLVLLAALTRVPNDVPNSVAAPSVTTPASAASPASASQQVAPQSVPLQLAPQGLAPGDSASKAWALRIASTPGMHGLGERDVVEKLPVWLGLALLFFVRSRRAN